MRIIHFEVGNNDGDRQSHSEDTSQGTQSSDKHAQVGLGHHVTIAYRGHGDQGPPQTQWDGLEVVVRIRSNSLRIVDQAGENNDSQDEKED